MPGIDGGVKTADVMSYGLTCSNECDESHIHNCLTVVRKASCLAMHSPPAEQEPCHHQLEEQARQIDEPGYEYSPSGHGVQVDDPSWDTVPAEH